ncbi:hypothetical protein quinque_002340 [Culex quinquefasciatus]|uniref:Uncharacterized protein n=1 Tax=Culex pipiens pipiens TaxID=38569 RepID=A0ABD1D6H2_CULPP
MLVYVRESTIHEVLEDVKSTDISDELRERLDEQRRMPFKYGYQDTKNLWTIFLEMASPETNQLKPIEQNVPL